MPVPTVSSSFGPATLPDVGKLSYNGVTWSALYKSEVQGAIVEDNARRTTKLVEWTLTADGVVTLPAGALTTDAEFAALRRQLSVHGQILAYQGNGFGGLNVNGPNQVQDVAFGPVPTVISFLPQGAGRSALVKWQVVVRIPELMQSVLNSKPPQPFQSPGFAALGLTLGPTQGPPAVASGPVLQFNYECSVTFNADGYSGLSIRGTLEIPLNRDNPNSRDVSTTVDDYRQRWLDINIDLTKFRIVSRNFGYSRDRRTLEFDFQAEELPPMGLPVGCTEARGRMSVRQFRGGSGRKIPVLVGVIWAVTLSCTYTVAANFPRETAYYAFIALWWFRMHCSSKVMPLDLSTPANKPQQAPASGVASGVFNFLGAPFAFVNPWTQAVAPAAGAGVDALYNSMFTTANQKVPPADKHRAIPIDFGFDEGLYLDSKTISFEASWVLLVRFQDLILASGVWRWLGPDSGAPPNVLNNPGTLTGGAAWASSMQSIMGWSSWLTNRLNPDADIVVDMGDGLPPLANPLLK